MVTGYRVLFASAIDFSALYCRLRDHTLTVAFVHVLLQVVPGAGLTMYSSERLNALLERLTVEAAAHGP